MPHFLEFARGRGTHFQRQRLKRAQIGKAVLDGVVARPQRIVFGVADRGRVVLVVALVVLRDVHRQPRMFARRLLGGEQLDGRLVGFDLGFGHTLYARVNTTTAVH